MFEPPTGPETDVPQASIRDFTRYHKWKKTDEGKTVFDWCFSECMKEMQAGEKRISVQRHAEGARYLFKWKINNTHIAWLADDYVEMDTRLLDLIERRVRKKPKILFEDEDEPELTDA